MGSCIEKQEFDQASLVFSNKLTYKTFIMTYNFEKNTVDNIKFI